jgi:hypothetical protein
LVVIRNAVRNHYRDRKRHKIEEFSDPIFFRNVVAARKPLISHSFPSDVMRGHHRVSQKMTLQRKVYGDAKQIEKSPHSETWGHGMRRSVGLKIVSGRSSMNARCVSDSSKFVAA